MILSYSNTEACALIVEGGAMRSVFSAGLLDGFLYKKFNPFDFYIGVSAGAYNLITYLAEMPGISINPDHIHTNIIFFEITREGMKPEKFVQQIDAAGIRMLPVGAQKVRAVTHYHITSEDIDQALDVISKVMSK